MMLGLFGSSQVAALGSIAAVLGGIVSLGSNVSTLQQTEAAMSDAELQRSDLINRIDPRVVGDSPHETDLTPAGTRGRRYASGKRQIALSGKQTHS